MEGFSSLDDEMSELKRHVSPKRWFFGGPELSVLFRHRPVRFILFIE